MDHKIVWLKRLLGFRQDPASIKLMALFPYWKRKYVFEDFSPDHLRPHTFRSRTKQLGDSCYHCCSGRSAMRRMQSAKMFGPALNPNGYVPGPMIAAGPS